MAIETNLTLERRQAMVAIGAWNDMFMTDYLDEAVASAASRQAIVTYRMADAARSQLSYGELNEKITRMAAGLASLGVAKGDVVSCQLPNWWQMTALHLACVRIGAVLNPRDNAPLAGARFSSTMSRYRPITCSATRARASGR